MVDEMAALNYTFVCRAIKSDGRINWPDWDSMPADKWDQGSLLLFKAHWEQQLKKKRRRSVTDRLKLCIELAQAELMRRVLVS